MTKFCTEPCFTKFQANETTILMTILAWGLINTCFIKLIEKCFWESKQSASVMNLFLLTCCINHVIYHNCNFSFYITNQVHYLQTYEKCGTKKQEKINKKDPERVKRECCHYYQTLYNKLASKISKYMWVMFSRYVVMSKLKRYRIKGSLIEPS